LKVENDAYDHQNDKKVNMPFYELESFELNRSWNQAGQSIRDDEKELIKSST